VKVVVLDYGSGNLRSAERALARTGATVTVTDDLDQAAAADGLVVPGVGAFAACIDGLNAIRGGTVVWDRLRRQQPVLGICVGMQILFERGVDGPRLRRRLDRARAEHRDAGLRPDLVHAREAVQERAEGRVGAGHVVERCRRRGVQAAVVRQRVGIEHVGHAAIIP
jgi:CTP synthase (UTP-ammonia lyase)